MNFLVSNSEGIPDIDKKLFTGTNVIKVIQDTLKQSYDLVTEFFTPSDTVYYDLGVSNTLSVIEALLSDDTTFLIHLNELDSKDTRLMSSREVINNILYKNKILSNDSAIIEDTTTVPITDVFDGVQMGSLSDEESKNYENELNEISKPILNNIFSEV